jgi:hypothetical protein
LLKTFSYFFLAASIEASSTVGIKLSSFLRPLFFEIPKPPVSAPRIFVGRKWLFREILEHLSSDLPTSKGITILGSSTTGKTSIILQLVQNSYFGQKGKGILKKSNNEIQAALAIRAFSIRGFSIRGLKNRE